MAQVLIFDTTLRDGEQAPGCRLTPPEKLRLAHQLDLLGVDVIEAGFPIRSPDEFAAVRQIATQVRRPTIAALARTHDLDIERAALALQGAERPRLHLFLATSDLRLKHRLHLSREACLERVHSAIRRARGYVEDVEFSAEDATRTDPDFLVQVVETALQAGARTINIPDTVGYAHPAEMGQLVETLFARVPALSQAVLSTHCHDDLGFAVANSVAALQAGARQVECTINGIGERAGNAALEEVVMALRLRADAFPFQSGINTQEIHRTSEMLSYFTGIHPQPNKAVVGRNVFASEADFSLPAGRRQARAYDLMTPEMVGVPETHPGLGKHSSREALARRYKEMGYELSALALERAHHLFQLLAEQKPEILDEDLIAILHHGAMEDAPHLYRLEALDVSCGQKRAHARVRLRRGEERAREATGEGDGPLAAAFTAIEALVSFPMELEHLEIQAATPGRDAVGEVVVRVRVAGKSFTGRGASTDIVHAAVRAYLHTLDKAEQAHELEVRTMEEASYLWGV